MRFLTSVLAFDLCCARGSAFFYSARRFASTLSTLSTLTLSTLITLTLSTLSTLTLSTLTLSTLTVSMTLRPKTYLVPIKIERCS